VNGNCSSDYSKPAANLTWWINDIQVPPNYLRVYDIQRHLAEHLESAVLEINFVVTVHHFIKSRLKVSSNYVHFIFYILICIYILICTVEMFSSNTRNLRAGERESDRGGSSQDSGLGQIP